MSATNTAEKATGAKTAGDVPLAPAGKGTAKKRVAAVKATPAVAAPAVPLQSVRAPFEAVGNNVRVRNLLLLKHVGGMTVLNTTTRSNLTPDESEVFDDIMYELRTLQRPLHRVENFSEFFDANKQFAKMMENSVAENAQVVAAIGLPLTPAELEVISSYKAIKRKVVAFFKEAGPQYPFVKKSSGPKLVITATHVSNGRYEMTHKQASNLWNRCRKVWESQDQPAANTEMTVGHHGTNRITINENSVSVGCQNITRWQVEQAAIQLGLVEA